MKKLSILMLTLVILLAFSSAAWADGWTIAVDLTEVDFDDEADLLELIYPNVSATVLTINPEYAAGSWIAGGLAVVPVSWSNDEYMDWETGLYGIYGGYTLVKSECCTLAAMAGYLVFNQGWGDGTHELEITSTALGLKGAAAFGPFKASLLYLYGVSNDYHEVYGGTYEGEADYSLLQFKGIYQFNEAWEAYLAYRASSPAYIGYDCGNSGFGLGVEFSF